MKKFFYVSLVAIFFFTPLMGFISFAATPTPTVSLLEKLSTEIASKTAQLNLVEKRGIIGTVTDASDTQITLKDLNGNTRFIDVDELTKFSSASSKSFGISDITKGTYLGVLGLYNKQSRRILAREVNVQPAFPKINFGQISLIDKANFELTLVKENQQKVVIEITDISKTYSFSQNALVKSGFSKTNVGDAILAVGFPDKQDPNKILGSRILIFPSIQLNYNLNIEPTNNPSVAPSTGSGVKLYPITK